MRQWLLLLFSGVNMFAKMENGQCLLNAESLDETWTEVVSIPGDRTARDAWELVGNVVVVNADKQALLNNVKEVTKLQFVEWCEANNKLTDLQNLLNSDATLMFKWNAASYLDITNPLVIGAAATLGLVAQDVFNEIGQ